MKPAPRQGGWTIWGLVMVVGLVAFFALLGLRLIPPYMDNYKIYQALQNVAWQDGVGTDSRIGIVRRLERILYIDYADEVVNLKETLVVEKKRDKTTLIISYEVVVPLAFNVSALLEFDNRADVR